MNKTQVYCWMKSVGAGQRRAYSRRKSMKMKKHEAIQGEHKHEVEFIWQLQIRIERKHNKNVNSNSFWMMSKVWLRI